MGIKEWDELHSFILSAPPESPEEFDRLWQRLRDIHPEEFAADWERIGSENWNPAIDMVKAWFDEGIRNMKPGSKSNLFNVNIGECPEIFSFEGIPCIDGQDGADIILAQVTDDEWDWMDEAELFDYDAAEQYCYHKTSELPSTVDFMEEKPDVGYALWFTLARIGILRAIRSADGDFPRILGIARTAVPLFIGAEGALDHMATLTPEGWKALGEP